MSQLRTYNRSVARWIKTAVEATTKQPVSIPEAKTYARIDHVYEDSVIDILISSAQRSFENFTGQLLYKRQVTTSFDCEGDSILILPLTPVVEIESVQSNEQDVDYTLKGDRIYLNTVGIVEVVYQCGLFEDVVDNEAKLGILKYIVSNSEDRQDLSAMSVYEMPNSSRKHWIEYKRFTL